MDATKRLFLLVMSSAFASALYSQAPYAEPVAHYRYQYEGPARAASFDQNKAFLEIAITLTNASEDFDAFLCQRNKVNHTRRHMQAAIARMALAIQRASEAFEWYVKRGCRRLPASAVTLVTAAYDALFMPDKRVGASHTEKEYRQKLLIESSYAQEIAEQIQQPFFYLVARLSPLTV